jgi:HTH-type transcriptional regulator/antitoxin HigA
MTEPRKHMYAPDSVTPPGETLEEVLMERGMSQAQLATRTGRPTKTINEIVKGKAAITPETALQFELVLGIASSFWTAREQLYRESLARARERKSHEKQVDWLKQIPYRHMVRLGWLPDRKESGEKVEELLRYFGVASASSWDDLWTQTQVNFRRSASFKSEAGSIAAWLRKGRIESLRIEAGDFSADGLRQELIEIRQLTRSLPDDFASIVVDKLSKVGVKLVFVPELPKTCAWGATRWLTQSCALIQLSLRYKTDDHLWFTLFHEAAHVLLHGKRTIFVDTDELSDVKEEQEANDFARDFLIPPKEYEKFLRRRSVSCAEVDRFALALGIASGIVVGRLQYDGNLRRDSCNDLKQPIGWGGKS